MHACVSTATKVRRTRHIVTFPIEEKLVVLLNSYNIKLFTYRERERKTQLQKN